MSARRDALAVAVRVEIREAVREIIGARFAGLAALLAVTDEAKTSRRPRAGAIPSSVVRAIRARLGCSQRALARLVGVTPLTVLKWEHGAFAPSEAHARRLRSLRGVRD